MLCQRSCKCNSLLFYDLVQLVLTRVFYFSHNFYHSFTVSIHFIWQREDEYEAHGCQEGSSFVWSCKTLAGNLLPVGFRRGGEGSFFIICICHMKMSALQGPFKQRIYTLLHTALFCSKVATGRREAPNDTATTWTNLKGSLSRCSGYCTWCFSQHKSLLLIHYSGVSTYKANIVSNTNPRGVSGLLHCRTTFSSIT